MFENKVFEGIHYSRFIASWINKSGVGLGRQFIEWLKTLTINGRSIPDNVIREIYNFGTNGKLELEESARNFMSTKG